ncbi:hypothetical protein [Flavobacterium sp. GCM10023249]|uniref:hypothetical protein n=1 Tax=unclassified Flavobacterium TaxID=196869 RepID=UPI003606AA15
MKCQFFLVLLVLPFLSCKNYLSEPTESFDLYFEKPQPVNDSELSKIPSRFFGSYCINENFFLEVTKDQIVTKHFDTYRFHKNLLDSLKVEFHVTKDKFISKNDAEFQFDYKFVGDSIELSDINVNTLFGFSDRQKMKRVGNCLILNEKDSVFWKAKIVRFDKKSVAIEYIGDWSDLDQFDSITKVKSKKIDSTKFILSPSRREFKKYLELSKESPFHKFNKDI